MALQARPLRIGTRGSPLALAQANEVRARLATVHGRELSDFDVVVIKTTGDRVQDRPLTDIGGKGLFTKEIEEALLAREIDLAVHSMKDMATLLPEGLTIGAVLPREDPRDAFISPRYGSLDDLPEGAIVGTSSVRRRAQVKQRWPGLQVVDFRGNVETRLAKLASGRADATLLAVAGLNRLGWPEAITRIMETVEMLPAVAQGAVAIEIRADDEATAKAVALLNDAASAACVAAERAFLARLEGSCRTPIAGLAELSGKVLTFRGMILEPDGLWAFEGDETGGMGDGPAMGDRVASKLLNLAGADYRGETRG